MTKLKDLAKGQLLISEPFLLDPNFKRTVVFLCEHQEEGSFGFILNRLLDVKLDEVLKDFPEFNAPLFYGGPVQPETLHFVHRKGDLIEGSKEIVDDVYWGGNFEALKLMIDQDLVQPDDFRFFLGYSGWGPGQLEDEMEQKSWINADGQAKHIFEKQPEELWKRVLKDLGGEFEIVANFPDDPSLN